MLAMLLILTIKRLCLISVLMLGLVMFANSCSPDKTVGCSEQWQMDIQQARSTLNNAVDPATGYCNNSPDPVLCMQNAGRAFEVAQSNTATALDCCMHPENCWQYV
ncbi:MAG: hypothetical protein JWQ09_4195 [Segetibacter sp.]|nr:hypothetical protein [Segetibacter sp.]